MSQVPESQVIERDVYRSTGNVSLLLFPPLACVTVLVAIIMAFVLAEVFFGGYYLIIGAPFIGFLPVLGCLYGAITVGKCRNRFLAFVLAVTAAAAFYPGYYHACLIRTFGLPVAASPHLFLSYLDFRMENDVQEDAAAAGRENDPAKPPKQGSKVLNWMMFTIEFLLVWGFAIGLALSRSSKAFCEECQAWKNHHQLRLPLGSGKRILEEFERGSLAIVQTIPAAPGASNDSACELTVECCPNSARCPTYFSLKDLSESAGPLQTFKGLMQNRTGPGTAWLVKQQSMLPTEIQDISAVITALRSLPEVKDLPAPDRKESIVPVAKLPFERVTRALATIKRVPPPTGGNVLTTGHLIVETLIGFSPLLLAIGGGIVAAYASSWKDQLGEAGSIALMVAGGVLIPASLIYLVLYADLMPSLYLMSLLRRELDRRVDAIVDYRDEDVIAIQVIPRQNWSRMKLEDAADVGYLRVDTQRRELLFEGDQERYRIPADSIKSIEIEGYAAPGDQTGTAAQFVVVLRAETETGPWEAPIAHRHVFAKPRTSQKKRELVIELQDRIREILT
ncbi:MAG: hypothetical protein AB7O26_05685 [Planctomycetaceae bacterium]